MQNEITQAIELLDQKIASLQKLRNQLATEFGQGPTRNARSNGNKRVGRKDQVADFIKAHGPATRAEIIQGTGIPIGTAAYALNDEERFVARDGKWHIKE
jgi:hypothetical protein